MFIAHIKNVQNRNGEFMSRITEIYRRKLSGLFVKLAVTLFACVIMLACFLVINHTMRFVTISVNNENTAQIFAPIVAPKYALSLAGVNAQPHDGITVTLSDDEFAHINLETAFDVTVTADGESVQFKSLSKTVQQVLTENGYAIGEHDYTQPALTEIVTSQTTDIELFRVQYVQYEIDDVIPYETEMQYTSLFYQFQDYVKVIQEGQDGYVNGILQDKIVNGEVVETTTISTSEHVEPVTEILKSYKAGVPVSELEPPEGITVTDNVPSSYSTVYEMKATGYYSATGKGSSGLGLYYGTFAVDPTVIPYGTKVYIVSTNGHFIYGWAIATDTGAFINTNRMQVDLFYETYSESAANGVQQVYVYVP